MSQVSFPKLEEEVLTYWEDNQIFKKTLSKDSPQGEFIFYEGPPTANGKPGIHHVLARAFKDLIPRYKTMQGFHVARKAGWDTHGLPVELEVEKKLGISGKPDIEKYGIEKFNTNCQNSVWQYKEEWEKLTQRMGFWLDLERPYITYHNDYIETLWWIIKQVDNKGLLYQGHKVVPHCPRCGTALSSHEVAQGYREVPDQSVFIKFKVASGNKHINEGDYILSWTTTPWTLPGNVALAIGEQVTYIKAKVKLDQHEENYIIAENLASKVLGDSYIEVSRFPGSDLVGLEYEPLFPGAIPESTENYQQAYQIYPADFVTVDDGTGIVHTAVMYGEDDYALGEQIGLPKHHTVSEQGMFTFLDIKKDSVLSDLKGKFVKANDTEKTIIDYLRKSKLLLKEETYKHDYPFCWRCDTPLLYYAKDSWFIKMSALREKLKLNNEMINWVPGHIKSGRFGEWLDGVKDWAISRERYWGTPLPVWSCNKCQAKQVIGSRQDLFEQADKKVTKIIFVRHGESEKNLTRTYSAAEEGYPLTAVGEKQAEMYAKLLQDEKIDVIYSSPTERTRQTADKISHRQGLEVQFDKRINEVYVGEWEDKTKAELEKYQEWQEYLELLKNYNDKVFDLHRGKNGESWTEVRNRVVDFVKEIEKKHVGQTIVVVTHQVDMVMFTSYLHNLSTEETIKLFRHDDYQVGVRPLTFYLNEDLKELNLHRPYIDEYELPCNKCEGKMQRDMAVLDCWFDSGSMPFAQLHYPFAHKDDIDNGNMFPADYISEAIDQTRGWFYTLLAVATLLDKQTPYQNVICLGHINDKHGKKMSKSKGNIIDPWEIMNTYGVDALRLHFYTMNQPGEPKNFDPKNVEDILKKNFLILWNVLSFYKMYAEKVKNIPSNTSDNVLDQWLFAKLDDLTESVTTKLNKYDITTAGRLIIDFINELSTWYVRRSRNRFKAGGEVQAQAVKTLGWVLLELSKIMAPFTPFIAEKLYQELIKHCPIKDSEFKESIHLENWPEFGSHENKEKVLFGMENVRKIVEEVLSLRAAAAIKVRQPLGKLEIIIKEMSDELIAIIKEEVNVKEVVLGAEKTKLDTKISEELKIEGLLREVIRQINSLRKQAKLTIDDRIELYLQTKSVLIEKMLSKYDKDLKQATLVDEIISKKPTGEFQTKFEVEDGQVLLGLKE